MAQRLNLQPHHHLLEVGSGWGGFAIYAAQTSGCRVTSITLSEEQLVEARKRALAAGVGDRVTFELREYRDVTETYDRIVRSEEHTSELQSLMRIPYAVFCVKKTHKTPHNDLTKPEC